PLCSFVYERFGVASRSVRSPKQPNGVEVNRSGYPGRSRRAKSTDRPRAGMAYCRRPTPSAAIMNSARSAANGVVPRSNTSALEPAPRRLKSVWTKRSDGVMVGALAVAARGRGAAPALSKPRGPYGAMRILAADSLDSSTLPASTPDSRSGGAPKIRESASGASPAWPKLEPPPPATVPGGEAGVASVPVQWARLSMFDCEALEEADPP